MMKMKHQNKRKRKRLERRFKDRVQHDLKVVGSTEKIVMDRER